MPDTFTFRRLVAADGTWVARFISSQSLGLCRSKAMSYWKNLELG